MQDFQVKLELDSPLAVITMHGDLTHASEQRMQNTYEKICSAKAKYILFDFSKVDYINSAGMSVIITILTKAQDAGQELRACSLSEHFQKIFDMIGLLKYIEHFETKEHALKDLPR